jgi:hypothetical protein
MYGAGLTGGFVFQPRGNIRGSKATNSPIPAIEPTPQNTYADSESNGFDDLDLSFVDYASVPSLEVCAISGSSYCNNDASD